MEKEFNGVKVVINDPQNRLMSGEKIEVLLTVNEGNTVFQIDVPEVKVKEESTEPKPKPVTVYQSKDYGVTGTICANGALKVGIQLAKAKLPGTDKATAKVKLNEAFDKTWAMAPIEDPLSAPPKGRTESTRLNEN